MSVWTVVVAAGTGSRFGGPKQFLALGDKRVLDWSVDSAKTYTDGVVLVVSADKVEEAKTSAADVVVIGGDTRSQSVRCGLASVPGDAEIIVVHDAARPLAGTQFAHVVGAVKEGADAAVPATPVTDTLKRVRSEGSNEVAETVDRRGLLAVQTPQAFRAVSLRAAHEQDPEASDDAALIEALSGRVVTVPGEAYNIKITYTRDLVVLRALLEIA